MTFSFTHTNSRAKRFDDFVSGAPRTGFRPSSGGGHLISGRWRLAFSHGRPPSPLAETSTWRWTPDESGALLWTCWCRVPALDPLRHRLCRWSSRRGRHVHVVDRRYSLPGADIVVVERREPPGCRVGGKDVRFSD